MLKDTVGEPLKRSSRPAMMSFLVEESAVEAGALEPDGSPPLGTA